MELLYIYIYRVYFMVFSSFGKVVFQVSPRLVWRAILLAAYSRLGTIFREIE